MAGNAWIRSFDNEFNLKVVIAAYKHRNELLAHKIGENIAVAFEDTIVAFDIMRSIAFVIVILEIFVVIFTARQHSLLC